MDRLNLFLIMMGVPAIAGTFVILFLSAGWYSWVAIALSVVLGLVLGIPASKMISRRIKKKDPNFNPPRQDGVLPDPTAPESY